MNADLAALLLIAPCIGSFLGVLIVRLPAGRPLVLSRSACDVCGATLGVRDLVPLASYLVLRGRCRHCGAPIAPMHLAVELAAAGIVLIAATVSPNPAALGLACALGWTLLALAWIDWQAMLLPDVLTLPLLLAGLGVTALCEPGALTDHAAAAAVAWLAMRGLALGYRRLRGREGLGAGDAKLLAACGAWMGLAALPWVLLLAATAGLAAAAVQICAGHRLQAGSALPFGPWLALALWLLWLWQNAAGGV